MSVFEILAATAFSAGFVAIIRFSILAWMPQTWMARLFRKTMA